MATHVKPPIQSVKLKHPPKLPTKPTPSGKTPPVSIGILRKSISIKTTTTTK